jgi:hypothetical protein
VGMDTGEQQTKVIEIKESHDMWQGQSGRSEITKRIMGVQGAQMAVHYLGLGRR